jgi:hypothetical protein
MFRTAVIQGRVIPKAEGDMGLFVRKVSLFGHLQKNMKKNIKFYLGLSVPYRTKCKINEK